MNEMYAESGVKCDLSQKDIGKIVLYFVVLVVSLVVSLMSFYLMAIPIGVATYGIVKASKIKYEYEYIFCDGQLDIDKITGNSKRKRMLRIDFDDCEVVAQNGSHALDEWSNKQLKEVDYTSHVKGKDHYVIIVHKDKELLKILFEPNEKMIECMRNKSRRLVHID
ncbi:MAG: DUF6106 family protein [bacterium]|nr:DUF6106 family protein [bacterium]